MAERLEGELGEERPHFIEGCQRDWNQLPRPDPPLTVGLDGGYVHARLPRSRTEGWFEVIAGKVMKADGDPTCFAFVTNVDTKSKRRLFEVLKSKGLQMNQRVEFLTDGGDTRARAAVVPVPGIGALAGLVPHHDAAHRDGPDDQGPGRRGGGPAPPSRATTRRNGRMEPNRREPLERLKWHLWHGNVYRALQITEELECDLESRDEESERSKKLLKAVREFRSFHRIEPDLDPELRGSASPWRDDHDVVRGIDGQPGDQQADGEEAADAVDRARAHLLLQVRTRVLNEDLRETFRRWYPGLKADPETAADEAA